MTWTQAFVNGVYAFVTVFGFAISALAVVGIIAFVANLMGALAKNDDDDDPE